jgi:hypothetical protein
MANILTIGSTAGITTLLTGAGHTVTTHTATDDPTSAFAGKDAVIMLQVAADAVATYWSNYINVNLPVMACHHFQYAGLNLATGNSAGGNQQDWVILDPSHPTAAGKSGTVRVSATDLLFHHYASTLGGGATAVARTDNTAGRYCYFTYEAGSNLTTGTAVNKRVGFGGLTTSVTNHWTTHTNDLFLAGVSWMLSSATGEPLATPTGWTFTKTANTRQLNGSWSAVTGAATYDYQVERWTGSAWVAFSSANTASTSFTLTSSNGVEYSTLYRSRVRAVPA